MYTTVAVEVPSATVAVVALEITGGRSVTFTVTACVVNAPLGSAAFTLKLYEGFVSKSGTALIVTTPVAELIVNAPASVPVRL